MRQLERTVSNSEINAISGADPGPLAPDCRGLNFYRIDPALRALLALYLDAPLRDHLEPHLDRLGGLAGGRLDELAALADRHPPVLHARDRFGRDQDRIEYHPAYHEMERIAFGEFGMHAMSHRAGVLGWPAPMPALAKYAIQYLFVQAEFGLMCPISVTDTSILLLRRYGDAALKERFLERMLSQDMDRLVTGAQFMTEKAGGSDVGAAATLARCEDGVWWLYGEKWFCSHADAGLVMLLARPEGAPAGTRGLALFAMPRRLEDGQRNAYRVLRLKDKLGSRSMASGEVRLDGALAYPLGRLDAGLKQMMDQVNLSRLSHGVRAAGMMRRCLNEALQAARHRVAFGRRVVEFPLLRRQLLKLMLPTEQALSMALFTADAMDRADREEPGAAEALRLLTPLLKFRACRDNVAVATGAMEVRGGNGYIEDWSNARLVRDAHLGVLWEGTSNINALDLVGRAVGRVGAQRALAEAVTRRLQAAAGLPGQYRGHLAATLDRAVALVEAVAARPEHERETRRAGGALYHAVSAALLAAEGAAVGATGGDARRLLLSRLVLEHRLAARDPLAPPPDEMIEERFAVLLLDERPVPLATAAALATA